jgi:MYXO-CTERM domain-containing protein
VEGGDGFTLWGTDNIQNAAHIDAVVLDVTLPAVPEPATFTFAALALLSLGFVGWRRRRR